MKKLLIHWKNRKTVSLLITKEDVAEISRRLVDFQSSIPAEFARRPRSLEDSPQWKVTENDRQFLLYTGPVILKAVLPPQLYDHFMFFNGALKMLSSSETCFKYNSSSRSMLHHFIRDSPKLPGDHFITYNTRCLIHMPDDVRRFGPVDQYSWFPFENFLYQIRETHPQQRQPTCSTGKAPWWDFLFLWHPFIST